MDSPIEKFLLNNKENDKVFAGDYPIKVHKEKYNDRFTILYTKRADKDYFLQCNYNVAGYLDLKDKCIYNYNMDMVSLLPIGKSLIKRNGFNSIDLQMWDKIQKYIEKYSFDNEEKLKDIASDKYKRLSEYSIDRYKKDVRKKYIKHPIVNIKLDKSYSSYSIQGSQAYQSNNVYIEYLDNPKKTIEKYANQIINYSNELINNKEELGLQLLIYRDKIEYLNAIQKNENNFFDSLYINKKIYQSIKDMDAKSLNITIQYGNNNLSFKYNYNILKDALLNDNKGSHDWGVAYDKVSNFIKENSNKENSRSNQDFLFTHIVSITYGNKELYHHDMIRDDKEERQEEIELEI